MEKRIEKIRYLIYTEFFKNVDMLRKCLGNNNDEHFKDEVQVILECTFLMVGSASTILDIPQEDITPVQIETAYKQVTDATKIVSKAVKKFNNAKQNI